VEIRVSPQYNVPVVKGITNMIKLLMNVRSTEKRIAILEQDSLVELIIEQPGRRLFVGDIIKGRVIKVVPGLQAVFVDIGMEKTGYLHKHELLAYTTLSEDVKQKYNISELVTEGSEIIVQVVKESLGSKGPKLTELISLPGRNIVYLPEDKHVGVSKKLEKDERERLRLLGESLCKGEEGLILRTTAVNMQQQELEKELIELRNKWTIVVEDSKTKSCPIILHQESGIVERTIRDFGMKEDIEDIIIDDRNKFLQLRQLAEMQYPAIQSKLQFYKEQQDLFSFYNIESEIEKSLQTKVWLKNGAFLVIEKTEAMTVIDVNTGKFTGKQNQQETVLKTNQLAASEIAKQIRLRNLSGMIIIDFISMTEPTALKAVELTLKDALKKDRNMVHTFGFTALGLYQLTRKKMREPLEAELLTNCPCCSGKGKIYSIQSIIYQLERELSQYQNSTVEAIWIEVSKEVHALLHNETEPWIDRLKNQLNLEIFVSTHSEGNNHYRIRQVGNEPTVRERYSQ
jgi:ribonuclease G